MSEGAASVDLTVVLSHTTTSDVSVSYATADGTATAGSDYQAKNDVLIVPSGLGSGTISIQLLGDGVYEEDETFSVALASPVGGALVAPNSAEVTIQEDEPSPTVAFEAAGFDVAEDGGSLSLNVVLSSPCAVPVSVTFATADGSATAGSDYTAVSQMVSFPALSSSQPISVTILDDGGPELDETVTLSLTAPTGAALGTPSVATLTILDNEPRPIAIITSPGDGASFGAGDTLVLDGTASTVPSGQQVWFGALEVGTGDPMVAAHTATTLAMSFTTGEATGYIVRLVIAEPESMPTDAALRGLSLPCADTPMCDSAQVTVPRYVPQGPFYLTARSLTPAMVKLAWTDPDTSNIGVLYRGTGPVYQDAIEIIDPGVEVFFDQDVSPGTTYYYKLQKVIGSTSIMSDVVSTTVPTDIDTTLSLLPTVTTEWPAGFTTIRDSRAVVTVALQPEDPAEDLVGATVELFVDEPTSEEGSAFGENDFEPGTGRDDPGCLDRSSTPTQTLVVSDPAQIAFQVPDMTHGQHGFRIRVTGPTGQVRERAFIRQINRPDNRFDKLRYVGAGRRFKSTKPRLFGYGPPSMFSPDCEDADPRYFVTIEVEEVVGTTTILRHYKATTNENGSWEFDPTEDLPVEDAPGGGKQIRFKLLSGIFSASTVTTGRTLELADQSTWDLKQTATSYGTWSEYSFVYDTIAIPYAKGGGAVTPYIDAASMPTSIGVADTSPIAAVRVRFRLLDEDQDLDLGSVRVTNLTLADAPVTGFMSEDQVGDTPPDDSLAYWAADVEMQAGPNQLRFEASDLAGHTMSETYTVTRDVPNVVARITSPVASSQRVHALIPLDGSASDGPTNMDSRWVFIGRWYWAGQIQTFPVPEMELAGLTGSFQMPGYDSGVIVRLVVATPGHLPADLYTADLPCSSLGGEPDCDSTEVLLLNWCCPAVTLPCYGDSTTPFTVSIDQPTDNEHLAFDQPFQLEASTIGITGEAVYRWWIEPYGQPSERRLLSPMTSEGTGFSSSHESLSVDPVTEGLSLGDYVITLEAGINSSGCIGHVESAQVVVHFSLDVSGVAPGQTLAAGQVRVYGSSFVPGVPVTILLDDDPGDPANERSFLLTPNDERYVVLDVPAGMTPGLYFVAAADSSGAGESSWKQALEILAPAYQVTNEEDPSCGGAGTECVHPIGFGQVVVGTWGEAGDVDYYYVTMGAGTTFDVTVSRVDTTLSPLHPDAVDPELFVVDPDGVVDGTIGYANDTSADDTDARIVGYTAIKSGVYTVATRSLKGTGDYTVTLTRTGTRTPAAFETLPYGDRAINVVETPGEPSQATLQAVVLDRFGDPVAGAFPQWQVVAGDTAATTHWYTASSGIAQLQAEMGTADQLDLQASFPWVYGQGGGTEARAAAPVAQLRRPTAVVGTVEIDTLGGAVVGSRLATPAVIERVRASIAREGAIPAAKPAATPRDLGDGFTTSSLTSCGGDVQRVTRLAIPPGATSVEDLELEILDDLGSAIPDQEITGLVVHERRNLQVRLIAHCNDGQGGTFDAPLLGARVALTVTGGDPSWAGGVVESGGSVCNPGVVEVDAELNPVTYEGGTRAVCVLVDENLEATFAATEVVTASAGIRTKTAAGTWTSVRKKAAVDVALEHDTPRSFHFYQPQDLVAPKGYAWDGCYDPSEPTGTQCIHGPAFTLLDEYNNVVVLWGKTDSVLHNEPATDEVYLSNPGTWGTAPWGVIRYYPDRDPSRYYPIEYPVSTTSPFFYGHSDWTVCVKTGEEAPLDVICSSFSVDNGTAYNILKVLLPWVADEPDLNADDYIDVMEPLLEESYRVAPGQPLRFYPSGKLAIFRVDPVHSDDSQPHSVLLDDVQVKIWVSGPHSQPGMVASDQLRPDGPFVPRKAEDVEIWTGSLVVGVRADTDYRCCWEEGVPPDTYQVCEDGHTRYYYDLDQGAGTTSLGEATLIASTEPPASLMDDCTTQESELGLIGEELPAFAITKAPSEPGWYTIVVETDDPRFTELSANHPVVWPSHHRVLHPMSFLVTGVEVLDANYQRVDPLAVDGPTQAYVRLVDPAISGDTTALTVGTEDSSGAIVTSPFDITLTRIGHSGVFQAPLELRPLGEVSPPGMASAADSPGGNVLEIKAFLSRIKTWLSGEPSGDQDAFVTPQLELQWLEPDGTPSSRGQVTRINEDPSSGILAEDTYVRVCAVSGDPATVVAVDANVRMDEGENVEIEYASWLYTTHYTRFTYQGDQGVATDLSPSRPLSESSVHLTQGCSEPLLLRSVAGPRVASGLEPPPYLTHWDAILWVCDPDAEGPCSAASADSDRFKVGELRVGQWVDQQTFGRPALGADVVGSDGQNGTLDWLEAGIWRALAAADMGDGVTYEASSCIDTLFSLGVPYAGIDAYAHINSSNPQILYLHPLQFSLDAIRWDSWLGEYRNGFSLQHTSLLSAVALHESRHCWQFSVLPQQGDADGDYLSPLPPSHALRLADTGHASLGGPAHVNTEGHLKGDESSGTTPDFGSPSYEIGLERDADYFEQRATVPAEMQSVLGGAITDATLAQSASPLLLAVGDDSQWVAVKVLGQHGNIPPLASSHQAEPTVDGIPGVVVEAEVTPNTGLGLEAIATPSPTGSDGRFVAVTQNGTQLGVAQFGLRPLQPGVYTITLKVRQLVPAATSLGPVFRQFTVAVEVQ